MWQYMHLVQNINDEIQICAVFSATCTASVPVFKGNVCDIESSYDAVDVGLTKEVLDLCDGWD